MKICKEARNWLVSQLKNAYIFEILQRDATARSRICKGGFKPTPQNIEKNRRLILQRLTALFTDTPTQLLITSVKHSPFAKQFKGLKEALHENGLRKYWRIMLQTLDSHRYFTLHLALESEDEKLSALGCWLLLCPMLWKDDNSWKSRPPKGANVAVAEQFKAAVDALTISPELRGLLKGKAQQPKQEPQPTDHEPQGPKQEPQPPKQGLLPLTPSVTPPSAAETSSDAEQSQQQTSGRHQANDKAARDATLRKERDELRAQVRSLQEQCSKRDAQLKDMSKRISEAAEDFGGAIAELQAQKEQDLRNSTAGLEARLLGVHPDLKLFAVQSVQHAGNLKERVTAVLDRQKALNGKTMMRQELMRRINRLEELQNKVKDALDDAISPVPELAQLENELEREIDVCRKKLGEHFEPQGSSIPERLFGHIKSLDYNDSDALKQFEALRHTLETPLWHSLLAPDELDAARKLISEREKLCTMAQNAATELQKANGKEDVAGLRHIMTLSSVKEHLASIALVVDGCNAMLRDPYWHEQIQLQGEKNARNDFIQRINRVLGNKFQSVTLVFDGQGIADSVETVGKIKVIFAAKRDADQNADNCIVNYLAAIQDTVSDDTEIMVCTDDGGLAVRLYELCDDILDTNALNAVITP